MSGQNRRTPIQGRSAATVDVILDAAVRQLGRSGYQGLSTNRVAREAHVSIGTVYRYFDDKAAIVGAARDRAEQDIMGRLMTAIVDAQSIDGIREGARHIFAALVDALERHRDILTAVTDALPLGVQSNVLPQIEEQLSYIVRMSIRQQTSLSDQETDVLLYLGMGAALNMAIRIVVGRPEGIDKNVLLDAAARLVEPVLAEGFTRDRPAGVDDPL